MADGARNGGNGASVAADVLIEERIGENDSRFRRANEEIEGFALATGSLDVLPFICECADRTCQEFVRMSLAEYEHVRANPRHFINVPGHQVAALGTAEVVEERDGYVIVEKQGHAGEVAEALDERTADVPEEEAAAEEGP